MTSRAFTEHSLIDGIAQRFNFTGHGVITGIGDDCAVLQPKDSSLLIATTDTLVEGIHFDLSWHPPDLLGRKSLAVNVSDIAAMGGVPRWALLNLGLSANSFWVEAFLDGLRAAAAEWNLILVGGDTVRSPNSAVITITLLGEVEKEKILYRSGARQGDIVWVSGTLGDAAAGLALCQAGCGGVQEWAEAIAVHLSPSPEVELGRLLAESGLASALIDTSDGIATDLAHICRASKCGAELNTRTLPISLQTRKAAEFLGMNAQKWALAGGEDYRLLFTTPVDNTEALIRLVRERLGRVLHPVGRVVEGKGVWLLDEDNGRKEISYQGFDHFPV